MRPPRTSSSRMILKIDIDLRPHLVDEKIPAAQGLRDETPDDRCSVRKVCAANAMQITHQRCPH